MTPDVSVLLPVFNAEQTLETCLRSLLRQGMGAWECVLVDDGSSDRSLELARSFAARDPRIRCIESDHRGLVETLNLGLARCRAPLVARIGHTGVPLDGKNPQRTPPRLEGKAFASGNIRCPISSRSTPGG